MRVEERVAESFIYTVCRKLIINPNEYFSSCRKQYLVDIRSCVYRILRNNTRLTLTEIGNLSNRHYTTVLNGLKLHEDLVDNEEAYSNLYEELSSLGESHFLNKNKLLEKV